MVSLSSVSSISSRFSTTCRVGSGTRVAKGSSSESDEGWKGSFFNNDFPSSEEESPSKEAGRGTWTLSKGCLDRDPGLLMKVGGIG